MSRTKTIIDPSAPLDLQQQESEHQQFIEELKEAVKEAFTQGYFDETDYAEWLRVLIRINGAFGKHCLVKLEVDGVKQNTWQFLTFNEAGNIDVYQVISQNNRYSAFYNGISLNDKPFKNLASAAEIVYNHLKAKRQ